MEEWISQNEYMKRYKIGFNVLKQMIANGELDVLKTEGGHYKIKVGGNTVSKELYEKALERAVQAETTLKLLQQILIERR